MSMEFIYVPAAMSQPNVVQVDLASFGNEDRRRKSSPMRDIIRRLSLRYRKKRPEKEGGRRPRPREYTLLMVGSLNIALLALKCKGEIVCEVVVKYADIIFHGPALKPVFYVLVSFI